MSHSNTTKLHPSTLISFKPIAAFQNTLSLLVEAFAEAKAMEQKTRKTSGNW